MGIASPAAAAKARGPRKIVAKYEPPARVVTAKKAARPSIIHDGSKFLCFPPQEGEEDEEEEGEAEEDDEEDAGGAEGEEDEEDDEEDGRAVPQEDDDADNEALPADLLSPDEQVERALNFSLYEPF